MSELAQSCPTLCDPRDCSPPGSSVRGISQARTLEWLAISSYRASSQPGIELASLISPVLAEGIGLVLLVSGTGVDETRIWRYVTILSLLDHLPEVFQG